MRHFPWPEALAVARRPDIRSARPRKDLIFMVMRDALTNRQHNITTDREIIEAAETGASDGSRKSVTTRLRETQDTPNPPRNGGKLTPSNEGGAPIEYYEVQYQRWTRSGDRLEPDRTWHDWPHGTLDTSALITGLANDTYYDVRVHAVNANGPGEWSYAGSERTGRDDRACRYFRARAAR